MSERHVGVRYRHDERRNEPGRRILMHFDNEWLSDFEMTAGARLRALFEKDLDAMPLKIADGLRRLREAEEKARLN